MRSIRLPLVLLISALSLACNGKAQRPPQPSPEQHLQDLRQSYQAVDPNIRLGRVIAVMPQANLAAVGEVRVVDFAVGQTVTFLDAAQQPKASGKIVDIVDTPEGGWLVVLYDTTSGAPPQVGDLALR